MEYYIYMTLSFVNICNITLIPEMRGARSIWCAARSCLPRSPSRPRWRGCSVTSRAAVLQCCSCRVRCDLVQCQCHPRLSVSTSLPPLSPPLLGTKFNWKWSGNLILPSASVRPHPLLSSAAKHWHWQVLVLVPDNCGAAETDWHDIPRYNDPILVEKRFKLNLKLF